MIQKILAVGDCNTLGAGELERKSYPERVAKLSGLSIVNRGHTMATTREGLHILKDHLEDFDCLFIQFGLVDSYKTFIYSPYVLYYPDNFLRKFLRSITKKFKKSCRKYGLNRVMGEVNVVPITEYESNIREMVELASPRPVVLIDTVPNLQTERNEEIQKYNAVLDTIAADFENCTKISLYNFFEHKLDAYYSDLTHCNSEGYEIIAGEIFKRLGVQTIKSGGNPFS